MNAITVKHISKTYKAHQALDDVSLTFETGKIYGLLGRNGAGKSTLINIIANRIFADQGEVAIDGYSSSENMAVQEKVFCMSEADLYDKDLRVRQHFKWIQRFYQCFDIQQAYTIAEKFNLNLDKKFKDLSKGYQSIFKLTVALALNIPYTIFDEPVLGLDANHRELFYQLLLEAHASQGRTFIIATHLIEEVANIIERVIIINEGQVLLDASIDNLLAQGYSISGKASDVDLYCQNLHVISYESLYNLKIAYILDDMPPLPANSPLQVASINLQKLFVKLTEKGGEVPCKN